MDNQKHTMIPDLVTNGKGFFEAGFVEIDAEEMSEALGGTAVNNGSCSGNAKCKNNDTCSGNGGKCKGNGVCVNPAPATPV